MRNTMMRTVMGLCGSLWFRRPGGSEAGDRGANIPIWPAEAPARW